MADFLSDAFSSYPLRPSDDSSSGVERPSAHHETDAFNNSCVVEDCYRNYFDKLVAGLRQLHGPHGFDAEDVAQRAFEQLAKQEASNAIRNPEAFVWRVAQNFALQDRRSAQVRIRHARTTAPTAAVAGTDVETPESALLVREELILINAALLAMDERRRLIFLMRRIERLTFTEIAAKLGISRPAVAKHLAKAVVEIDAHLSDD
ncbi:MAG: sigma-70 family RNA polymerase sigma factor [Pseudomonadota bacterium]